MAEMTLRVSADATQEHVVVQLDMDGEPCGHINLDAPATDHHLEMVAKHRAVLTDEVPRDLDPGSRLEAIRDPVWRTMHVPDHGIAALALRHPGLGWLTFGLPADAARALGQALLSIADQLETDTDPA